MDVSFGTIWEAIARDQPDTVAISEPDRDYTFAEFDDRAARLAAALEAAGVGPGDKVGCYLYNGAAYLETVFAAFKLGAVPVNVNYRYTQDELTALLADADAAALVYSGDLAANVTHAARTLAALRLLVRVGESAPGAGPDAPELADLYAATAPRPAAPRPGADQLFMYTGGTTGKPKGVVWHLSDLLQSMQVAVFRRLGVDTVPGTLDELVTLARAARAQDRSPVMMPVVPLMHATGLFNCMGALLVGGRVVTARRGGLDPRHIWETVATQRVATLVVAGNAVCQPLVDELLAAEQDGTASRPEFARLCHQLGDGAERPAEARPARAVGRHNHGRARVQRGRSVRLRGHLVGGRPAVSVLPRGGHPGADRRRRGGGAGQRPGRHPRLRRADP